MRSLAQPQVLRSAGLAALGTSGLCFPRLWLATSRVYPVWYLEAVLFLGGMVLWGFVFAWHQKYANAPVFTVRFPPDSIWLATLSGLAVATILFLLVDDPVRKLTPEDYPTTFRQWGSTVLFSLAFSQLLLVFAPFAWLVRLFHRREPAIFLTVLFGVVVLLIKNHSSPVPFPTGLLSGLVLVRIAAGFLSVWLFLRGGVLLVWWWGFLVHGRHLLHIHDL